MLINGFPQSEQKSPYDQVNQKKASRNVVEQEGGVKIWLMAPNESVLQFGYKWILEYRNFRVGFYEDTADETVFVMDKSNIFMCPERLSLLSISLYSNELKWFEIALSNT